jgi:hypothetical protein
MSVVFLPQIFLTPVTLLAAWQALIKAPAKFSQFLSLTAQLAVLLCDWQLDQLPT